MAEPTYDLFLAYADADRAWVEGFLRPALGVPNENTITTQTFRPGAPVVDECERAVTSSCYTVLVLSPAFLADRWAEFGEQLASFASVEEGRAWLVAIVLQPCQLPLRLRFRVLLDCTDRTQWDEQVGRLRDLFGRPEAACRGPVPVSRDGPLYHKGRPVLPRPGGRDPVPPDPHPDTIASSWWPDRRVRANRRW